MNLLLDTHTLLWWLADDAALSDGAAQAIADEDNGVFVSAASAWEISVKARLGKLDAPEDLAAAIHSSELEPLVITIEHAELAGALPPIHADPFDRMLIAQANLEQLTVVTRDSRIAEYGVFTLAA